MRNKADIFNRYRFEIFRKRFRNLNNQTEVLKQDEVLHPEYDEQTKYKSSFFIITF